MANIAANLGVMCADVPLRNYSLTLRSDVYLKCGWHHVCVQLWGRKNPCGERGRLL